jgi:uncharacterized membrane protein YcaP (DUF421 family)
VSPDLPHIAVRAAFGYVALLALLRVSGKRTVAEGTPFDFVLALVLGDMVDDLLWADVPAAGFVVAVSALTLVHILVSWLKYVSPRFDRVVSGSATLLLSSGEPVRRGLRSEHVAESELEELLRLWGVPRERWPEVERALLETEGHPSLVMKGPERPAARGDLEGRPGRP